jgi:hypothetical protein
MFGSAGPSLIVATDELARYLEDQQALLGEGPSLTAFAEQSVLALDDFREEATERWPALAQAVARTRVGRFLALPLRVGGIRLGVLSVYSRAPGRLARGSLPAALLAADTAAVALLDDERESPEAVPLSEVGPHLDYRVHQATGMVMGQTGLNGHDALSRLRARAFRDGVPLPRLAADVITRRLRFDQEDG